MTKGVELFADEVKARETKERDRDVDLVCVRQLAPHYIEHALS